MPEWYTQIAAGVVAPSLQQLAEQTVQLFFLGWIPGIISMLFSGPPR